MHAQPVHSSYGSVLKPKLSRRLPWIPPRDAYSFGKVLSEAGQRAGLDSLESRRDRRFVPSEGESGSVAALLRE